MLANELAQAGALAGPFAGTKSFDEGADLWLLIFVRHRINGVHPVEPTSWDVKAYLQAIRKPAP